MLKIETKFFSLTGETMTDIHALHLFYLDKIKAGGDGTLSEEDELAERYQAATGKRFRLRLEHNGMTRLEALRAWGAENPNAGMEDEVVSKPKFTQV